MNSWDNEGEYKKNSCDAEEDNYDDLVDIFIDQEGVAATATAATATAAAATATNTAAATTTATTTAATASVNNITAIPPLVAGKLYNH